ncbi:MAG: thioesterase family protein [Erysipelotrichales bacterium]|nr:thioesterase family protein [Erysipelotrichales bacterium]
MLKLGIKNTLELLVGEKNTAKAIGSGNLEVFATPAMIALIEETAWKSVAAFLNEGESTVGTKIDINHISATPLGLKVICNTKLIEIDRRRLVFHVEVFDEVCKIGEGTHERFIIDSEKFISKTNEKKNS